MHQWRKAEQQEKEGQGGRHFLCEHSHDSRCEVKVEIYAVLQYVVRHTSSDVKRINK